MLLHVILQLSLALKIAGPKIIHKLFFGRLVQYILINEVFAQISFSYLRIIGQILRKTFFKYPPFEHDVGLVGDREGLLHIVVGNQDTDIFIRETTHNLLDIFYCNRVYAGKRLIQ